MKRELLCKSCAERARKIIGGSRLAFEEDGSGPLVVDRYPGEHSKFVYGTVNPGSNLLCDHCNTKLTGEACAVSIWADYGGIPYYPWEDAYLNIEK